MLMPARVIDGGVKCKDGKKKKKNQRGTHALTHDKSVHSGSVHRRQEETADDVFLGLKNE